LRKKTLQPNFYVYYEFKDVMMPGDHTLKIECWDEDVIGDDTIGVAKIDIENRWFTSSWYDKDQEGLEWRPKEWLPLMSPITPIPQGKLEVSQEAFEILSPR